MHLFNLCYIYFSPYNLNLHISYLYFNYSLYFIVYLIEYDDILDNPCCVLVTYLFVKHNCTRMIVTNHINVLKNV